LQPADRLDAHRAISADTPQVVPHQVHDHHILGPVLDTLQQFAAAGLVLLRRRPARPGALDRPRLDFTVLHAQETLRRGTGDREARLGAGVSLGGPDWVLPEDSTFCTARRRDRAFW